MNETKRAEWRVDGMDDLMIATVGGPLTRMFVARVNESMPNGKEVAKLIVAAVNAWNDPAALRKRLEELER